MLLVDTHCHINDAAFVSDVDAVIQRARQADVSRLLVVGFDLASSRIAVDLAKRYDGVAAAIGVHPEAAGEWTPSVRAELIALSKDAGAKVAAWGEIGLDYHWQTVPRDVQSRAFTEQIEIAVDLGLPMSVHCRESHDDVIDHLVRFPEARAALHCFTGTSREAAQAIEAGYYLGAGGVATFKKNDALRETLQGVPLERLLLETDSPYLAPQARRGKRNEPAYVALIADALAVVLGVDAGALAKATTKNASRLFGAWASA
ncbi:MAG: TatD family hydrolase [Capsulimonadaceae bacterium]|nr:TatD family hydrolase [Capsulimonadaceae bacterium]